MYKRIVIKIGTGVITEHDCLEESVVRDLVRQVVALRERGIETVIVSSGAVATGRSLLSSLSGSEDGAHRQVYAAVGQIGLMSLYSKIFSEHRYASAQVLVTKEDFRDKNHYASMKRCFENLLRERIVPIVNENDVIARHELSFSDNDELAGLVASQINADLVVMLSSVDGILEGVGTAGPVIAEVTPENAESLALHVTEAKSVGGRGGMKRKFEIAKRLMAQGIEVFVGNGRERDVLIAVVEGDLLGTRFIPDRKLSAIKRRLSNSEGLSAGAAYVDARAEEVLLSGGFVSLLPVGITKIEGNFKKGDVIEIRNSAKKKIGSGIAQYDATKAVENCGKKGAKALVHYDYLFIG
ncbi:MAG: glutamate 5-kinase [Parcubacteria group bacterium Greene0714_7]|nr:MAG: glutamate 5-kinase [Parcubacteria group bacterium Greene0714_7]